MGDSSYVVKRIDFFGRQVKIYMQNKNGPCPLLAIANVLSLRNELKLPVGVRDITQSDLITSIVDLLLERSKAFEGSGPHAADYARNVSDVFPVLQKLTTGIDVNVKFHNAHAFEPTPEVAVFDLLGIPLVHGWLVDPLDGQAAAVFGTRSYNELMEVLLAGLDESEVEALSTGPLRNLSISHSSFSQAHQHALEQQQQQQDSQQQHMPPVAEGAVQPLINLHEAPQQTPQQQQQVAAAGLDQDLPQLPHISTSSSSNGVQSYATEAAAAAVDAAVDNAEDAVIEELVEEMLQHVCCDNMPSKIELGDSPTRSTSLTRKLAFEGAGPSRLGVSSNNSSSNTTKQVETAAGATGDAANVAAGEQQDKRQQQQQAAARGAAVADAHVVRGFMEAHCSQLTPYGLASLSDSLKEHQLAVFFRNNHFNALFKYEGAVYLLVTDQGYEAEPDIVWERLDSVNGDTTFCTGAFSAFVPHRDPATLSYSQVAAAGTAAGEGAAMTDLDAAIAASLAAESGGGYEQALQQQQRQQQQLMGQAGAADGHEDADFALALQLQLQEEEEAARIQAQRQQQQQQQGGTGQQQQQPAAATAPALGLQQQADSLASSVRQMGRRIASGVDRAASNIQQQAAQFTAQQGYHQQPAMAAAGGAPQQQYMQQQQHPRRGSASCGTHGSGTGRRRPQQQEEKCSIM